MNGAQFRRLLESHPPAAGASATALAVDWWRFMRAAEEPGICDEESGALIDQADCVLDRLAEIPAGTAADLAAKILVWNCEGDGGETIIGMRLQASIVADAQRLASAELSSIFRDPMLRERSGLLAEARERGAVWTREHLLRPDGLLAAVPPVLRRALAADLSCQSLWLRLAGAVPQAR